MRYLLGLTILLIAATSDGSDSKLLRAGNGRIPGQYLVALEDSVTPAQAPDVIVRF